AQSSPLHFQSKGPGPFFSGSFVFPSEENSLDEIARSPRRFASQNEATGVHGRSRFQRPSKNNPGPLEGVEDGLSKHVENASATESHIFKHASIFTEQDFPRRGKSCGAETSHPRL
ncbi:MAG: hypothetical protein ACREH5_00130, partial [Candidatus Omnitrophota bacterium]